MKDPREWDAEYLLSLLGGEYSWLEAKGRRALDRTMQGADENMIKKNMSIDIAAMANSGGGQIVYGVTNPRASSGWQADDGGVSLTAYKPNTKEWLDNIVPVLVDPHLRGVDIYPIVATKSDSTIGEDRALFIIDVPNSEVAPHQAHDHVYYGRAGAKSIPLNHQFVSDIFHRRRDPEISLQFEILIYPARKPLPHSMISTGTKDRYFLRVQALNVGRVYAKYVNVVIYVHGYFIRGEEFRSDPHAFRKISGVDYHAFERDNQQPVTRVIFDDERPHHSDGPGAILPGLSHVWYLPLSENILINQYEGDFTFNYETYADNAPMRKGSITLRKIPKTTLT